jgi:hypothetical protein
MVKAIVAMQIAPTSYAQHCACSDPSVKNSAIQSSSTPLTLEHLEQLFLKLIEATPKSPDSAKAPEAVKPEAGDDKAEPARASKLEFKTVNEMYVPNET